MKSNYITRGINVRTNDYIQPIEYVQGTNMIDLQFEIYDFVIPTGSTATVYVTRPDRTVEYDAATVDTATNTVTVDVKNTMFSVAGTSKLQVAVLNGDDKLVTFEVQVNVRWNNTADGTQSKDVISAIDSGVEKAAASATAAANSATAAANSATAAGQSATQAGQSATQAGQSATLAGQQADNAAKSEAEAARYAAQIAGDIDSFYNRLALQVTSKEAMDALFVEWWHENWVEGTTTRLELLERWFGSVLQDARTHGVKEPLFATSNTAIAELTDDSVGLTCVPSTEAAANRDDFAGLPQFWALEVSWEKTTTGRIEVYAVELIDDIDVVRSGESHMCGVAQKNTYFRDWIVDGYHYLKTRCYPSSGYTQWDDGKTADGVVHAFAIRPKYCTGGINKSGVATCGTNLAPMNSMAGPTTGVTKWRARGARYAGARGSVLFWQLAMIRLKYARKGNSGTIEGCTGFYTYYAAAVSETAVSRILLTAAQAANLFVGCNTCIGDGEYASTKANNVRIKSITPVTMNGATYSAVILDTTTTFDVVAGTTKISVLPYWSGWCDTVKGNDGSRYSATSGKETGLIQKTEFQNGAYQILADELWQWGKDADGNFTFNCYTCDDQSKVTTGGTVSADYKKLEGATMTLPANQGNGWLYIEDMMAMPGGRTLWPRKVSGQAGSGTGVRAGFSCSPAASGLRAAWCCCDLSVGGSAGLAARVSSYSVGYAYWRGSVGCPSMAG